jgi:hypothetical protein
LRRVRQWASNRDQVEKVRKRSSRREPAVGSRRQMQKDRKVDRRKGEAKVKNEGDIG